MKLTIYYYTATGNSLKVAKDITMSFEDVELIKIHKNIITEDLATDSDIIGFIVPSIFSGMPNLVDEFIEKLKISSSSSYIFAVATHGDKNGDGIVYNQINKVLKKKNLFLSSYFSVRMPHNMPAKDHITTPGEKEEFFAKEPSIVKSIVENIKNRKSIAHKSNGIKNLLDGMTYNGINLLNKKFPLDKGFSVDEKCISCKICSKVCPANNIEIVDGNPKWKLDNCQFCFACVQWCPKDAIQYKKTTIGIERYHQPEIEVTELFID